MNKLQNHSRPVKICVVIDTFLPVYGGAEVHVLELSRALRDKGLSIKICTATPGGNTIDTFDIIRLPSLSSRAIKSVFGIPGFVLSLSALARRIHQSEIVHCHYTYLMTAFASFMAFLFKKPCVTTLHGLGTLDSSVKRSVAKRILRYISFKFSTHIIATSDEMKDVAGQFVNNKRINIIPNGVNTSKFKANGHPEPNKTKIIVLSMRRLAPKNGVQYLVEAMPFVIKELPTVEFWIAGEDKLEKYIRERVEQLNVGKFVKYLGKVPHERVKDYYEQADIVVFPSSAESTSLACLEAMAMGKTVVASSLGPYKLMLGDNERGVLVELFDREHSDYNAPLALSENKIKALAEKIICVAEDSGLRKQLGIRARAHVIENYDWQKIASETIGIYSTYLRK